MVEYLDVINLIRYKSKINSRWGTKCEDKETLTLATK